MGYGGLYAHRFHQLGVIHQNVISHTPPAHP